MVERGWSSLEKVLRQHPHIFPKQFVSFEQFRAVYAQVFSRCLAWGIDSASMVPVADLFNHECG